MVKHYIILSSAYSIGKRIALHYVIDNLKMYEKIQKDIDYIELNSKNDLHLSAHYVQTESKTWDSVVEHDGFFKNIKVIRKKEEFIRLINEDKDIIGIDVANYILSKVPCNHLKLEKLVYLSYADYLCETGKSLFTDRIYAYKLGPIISSVYKKYKKNKEVLYAEDNEEIKGKEKIYMPARTKITSSKDGLNKVYSIDKTLEKYGLLKDTELVEITHKKDSPWSIVGYDEKKPKQIKKEIILNYHSNEI